MSNDPNKKHYFDTIAKEEAHEVFSELASSEQTLNLWVKGKAEEDVEEFEVQSFNPDDHSFTLKLKASFFKRLGGSKLVGKEVLMKAPYERFHYFTTGKLIHNKENGLYHFATSGEVFKSQQRQNYRLNASRFHIIQFKIDNEVFDGLDISAGGTSIKVSALHKERFAKGKLFETCRLRFNRYQFDIPKAQIAGVWEQKDRQGNITDQIKLGIAFVDLPKGTEEELFKLINSEARAEELRKKFG